MLEVLFMLKIGMFEKSKSDDCDIWACEPICRVICGRELTKPTVTESVISMLSIKSHSFTFKKRTFA